MLVFIVNIISFFLCRKLLIYAGLLESSIQPSYFASRLYIHLGISLIPGILILNQFEVNHYLLKNLNPETFKIGGYYIAYSIFIYGFLMWVFKTLEERIVNYKYLTTINSWVKAPIRLNKNETKINGIMLFTVSLYLIYLLKSIGFISLFQIFSLDNLLYTRSEISESFKGIKFIKEIFQVLTIVTSYKCYILYKLYRSKLTKYHFFLSVILTILFLTHKFEKAPLIFYLLGFVFLNYYLGYRISLKVLVGISFALLGILSLVYISVISNYTSIGINIFTSGPLGRILIGPSMGYYLSLEAFPFYYDHLGISSFSRTLSNIFDMDYSERSARLLQYVYNKSAVRSGTAGVINSYYLGESWANFGIKGIILSPLIVSLSTYISYRSIIALGRTSLGISILAAFSLSSPIHGGFNDYLYSLFFLLLVTVLFGRLILNYYKKC